MNKTRISATASMGLKLKIFSDFENVSPHCSITVEDEVDAGLSREDKVAEAGELYQLCRKYVQSEMEQTIKEAKGPKK